MRFDESSFHVSFQVISQISPKSQFLTGSSHFMKFIGLPSSSLRVSSKILAFLIASVPQGFFQDHHSFLQVFLVFPSFPAVCLRFSLHPTYRWSRGQCFHVSSQTSLLQSCAILYSHKTNPFTGKHFKKNN